jgi:ABC-2 type transport system ATP-binding protein
VIALELAGVTKRYGTHRALDDVSLALPAGASVGLLGPNGAGKTTALRLALGFARPSRGGVRLRGHDPFDPAARERVGYLPERLALPRRTSVAGFLRAQAALAGVPREARSRCVEEAIERTGLGAHADQRTETLSKGLAQRVGFASALLGAPEVLLLDEPTSGLDPIGVRDARDWILATRARGATVLVSSHVLSEVERTCEQVVILARGRVAASGPLRDVVAPGETLEDAFVRLVRA